MIPTTSVPRVAAAWIAKLPQPQPTKHALAGPERELGADELELRPLGLLQRPRAARVLSDTLDVHGGRPSRGRARRTRWRRRGDGAQRARHEPGCDAGRAGAARPPGHGGGSVSPRAHTAASASRALIDRCSGGGCQSASRSSAASRSSTSSSPATYAPDPQLPGGTERARHRRRRAHREHRSVTVRRGSSVLSQNRTANGREGSVRASRRRNGPVRANGIHEHQDPTAQQTG